MFQSQIIAPMVIMTGKPEGTLSRRFSSWAGPSKVTFHPKHWMDKKGCCTYLEWLRSCYPGEKLGLIWDAASSHFSDEVKQKAAELNIALAGIPPGCTSLIQICDLIANKPIKQAFKKSYAAWKIVSDPGPGGKYKVDRKDVLSWLEHAIEDVNARMSQRAEVAKAFATYGQDPRLPDCSALAESLAKHERDGVYRSLLNNQEALNLE
jgi:transposase